MPYRLPPHVLPDTLSCLHIHLHFLICIILTYSINPQATLKLGLMRLHPAFMLTGLSFYEPTEAVPLHIHDR